MSKIKVYYGEKYDILSDKRTRTARPGTREVLIAAGCAVIEATVHEVDNSSLDGNGFVNASEDRSKA